MKTSLEEIAKVVDSLSNTCDAWGKDATCDKSPVWQAILRHTTDGKGCPEMLYMFCDECRSNMHATLMRVPPWTSMKCDSCGEGGLHVPDSFIIREERI